MNLKIATLLLVSNVWAIEIALQTNKESDFEVGATFIKDTLSLLPKTVFDVIRTKNITVVFKDLNRSHDTLPDPCAEGTNFKYGNYRSGKITLDERFLDVVKNKEDSTVEFPCKHKNYYKIAQASLIHEVAHAYDNKFLWSKRVSNDFELRSLGFWDTESPFNKNYNTYHKRSPDSYEYDKRKEFFAVNFEYFILDPEYKCRRPDLYEFYKKELKFSPHEKANCKTDDTISFTTDAGIKTASINKNLIKEVHFLFAAEGPQMMSKWGHSMFKLIVCKDEDDTLEECRENSKDHIVISFLAYIEDLSIDSVKGIFGKYPSRMLVSDLGAVKRQYTRGEFRSLKSLPLAFNEEQRGRFLNQMLRVYWEYAGRYFFFTNNCADEAFKLVQTALNTKQSYKKDITTPLGLYKHLVKSGLADESVLDDLGEATEKGFYHPSFGDALTKVYNTLKTNYKDMTFPAKVEVYTKLAPLERRKIIETAITQTKEKSQLYSLLSIEGHAQYLDGQGLLAAMTDFKTLDGLSDEYKKMLEETVELKNTYLYGKDSSEIGYGIPVQSEISVESEDSLEIRSESDKKRDELLAKVRDEIKRLNTKHFIRYEEASKNMLTIKKELLKK